jgi:exonuclease SbcC
MRPVRLDLAGFASFREPAVVDFTDADYFALVGPTGSGKSTVIDAMTFALYGSAPRWGRTNAIADALAPTANRCTVRLVFDIGPTRYVVAREVRRTGRSVAQRNVVLERLLDNTGTGAPDEESEVIAGDLREVNQSIERILGLSFSDFCQCIVLPQGQFAEFLQATPRDRQEILLKLLGAGHYEAIGRAATARAALAGEKATVLTAQLGDLVTATQEAETAARAHEVELADLAAQVDAALPAIAAVAGQVDAATAEQRRLIEDQSLLTGERIPADVSDLQSGLDDAERQRTGTLDRERDAAEQDTAARSALAAGPSRAGLEATIERHRERAGLIGRRAEVEATDRFATKRQAEARAGVESAEQAVGRARDQQDHDRAAQSAAAADHEARLQRRRELVAVRTPDGIDVLGARTTAARQGLAAAASRRESAETADQQARDALRQAPARGPLEQAVKDLTEQAAAQDRLAAITRTHQATTAALTQADGQVDERQQALAAARLAHEQAGDARTAATLRPHLVAGHACPVCEQTVTTLPPPLATVELDQAKDEVARAERDLAEAQGRLGEASRAETATATQLGVLTEHLDRLDRSLAGLPLEVELVRAELAWLDGLVTAADTAAIAFSRARDEERTAAGALDRLGRETTEGRNQLLAVHGPLIAAGAPVVDDTDLPAAWVVLTGWASARIADLDENTLPDTQAALSTATAALADATAALQAGERARQSAQTEHTDAVTAAARAAGEHRTLIDRLAELDAGLAQAPTAEDAAAELELCSRLEMAARDCEQELLAARTARTTAERAHATWAAKAGRARTELRAARDRLVPLGAPQIDDTNLAQAWADLLAWAAAQARARTEAVPAVTERIEQAEREHQAQVGALRAVVGKHEIDFRTDDPPAVLPARVATALERARSRTRQIAEKRSRSATLTAEMTTAREEQQVAKLLADLLRFDKFPRWLATAALDTLVADASAALSDLSGGQFDLSHDRGEFVVVDHADADSRRSVRTLSGGETFQASLALALALSAQMSTLAAEGAARLDSIFLDEGFGTLDPETLEVVAGTLENLAHGERMVGVITHVAALADRAPVRFAVHRDNRTSTIVREGA